MWSTFHVLKQYKWPIGVTSSLVLVGTCCFHWRAKILSAYLSFTLGIPVRVQQCYFGKAWLKLVHVKVIAEQESSTIPAEALHIPELRIYVEQQTTGKRRVLNLELLRPQVNLVFQNMQMTDNNWRRLARLSKEKGHLKRDSKTSENSSVQLGRIFLERGATLSVQSCPLQQKLIEDIHLQEMYLDTNEFRSFDGFVGFLERISAKNILEGNVLAVPPAAKQALKNYANDVVRQRWDSTKVKLNEKVEKWSKILEDSTKSLDKVWQQQSNTWKVNNIFSPFNLLLKYILCHTMKQWKDKGGISTLGESWLNKFSSS